MTDNRLALVTGASGGIGRALATLHARKGGDLIITARRLPELEALASQLEADHDVSVTAIAADIGTDAGLKTLIEGIEGREIEFLINNAGFGGHGAFIDRDLADDLAMLDLNVKAVMALCHAVAPGMVSRGKGRILNVSSTAAAMPGPLQATYFASKAFVTSFSMALDEELREKGVTVTTLAPGYVETDFASRADLEGTPLTQRGQTAEQVARVAYDGMRQGQLLVINETMLSIAINWIIPLLPRRMVLRMVRKMQSKA